MTRWLVALAALVACGKDDRPPPAPTPPPTAAPTPPPPPSIDQAALLEGKLPEGLAETELVNARCRICHGAEYLTQQRLSDGAWRKTIEKMRKFGATLSDEEVTSLVAYAVRYWNPDLPPRTWKLGPPPDGALPVQ